MLMCARFDAGQPVQFSESSGALGPVKIQKYFTIACDPQVSSAPCDSWTLNWIAGNATEAAHVQN